MSPSAAYVHCLLTGYQSFIVASQDTDNSQCLLTVSQWQSKDATQLWDDIDTSSSLPASSNFLGSLIARELVGLLSTPIPQGRSLSELGGFIHLIPVRLGVHDALDSAVKCLCSAYSNFLSAKAPPDTTYYSRALSSLRQTILIGKEALSSEVLCAVVCLSWYEVWIRRSLFEPQRS